MRSLPVGVSLLPTRLAAFHVDPSAAELHTPLSNVFRRRLPKRFSILAAIKPKIDNSGFLLTISDIDGSVKLAIQVGSNPAFQYSEGSALHNQSSSSNVSVGVETKGPTLDRTTSFPSGRTVRFPVELSDGSWHFVGYSVDGNTISMHKDCELVATKELKKEKRPKTGPNSVISLGKTLRDNPQYPSFEVNCLLPPK